jgi:hypothetical protein
MRNSRASGQCADCMIGFAMLRHASPCSAIMANSTMTGLSSDYEGCWRCCIKKTPHPPACASITPEPSPYHCLRITMEPQLAQVRALNTAFEPILRAKAEATVIANKTTFETWREERAAGALIIGASYQVVKTAGGRVSRKDKLSYALKAIRYFSRWAAVLPRWMLPVVALANPVSTGFRALRSHSLPLADNPILAILDAQLLSLEIGYQVGRSLFYAVRSLIVGPKTPAACEHRIRMKEYWRTSRPIETVLEIAIAVGAISLTVVLTPVLGIIGAYAITGSLSIVSRCAAPRLVRFWKENRRNVLTGLANAFRLRLQLPRLEEIEVGELERRILLPAVTSSLKCSLSGEIASVFYLACICLTWNFLLTSNPVLAPFDTRKPVPSITPNGCIHTYPGNAKIPSPVSQQRNLITRRLMTWRKWPASAKDL